MNTGAITLCLGGLKSLREENNRAIADAAHNPNHKIPMGVFDRDQTNATQAGKSFGGA